MRQGLMTICAAQHKETEPIFRQLEIVAVGSIFEKLHTRWDRYELQHLENKTESHIAPVRFLFMRFLKLNPVKHFCFRNEAGPLTIEPVSAPDTQYTITQHFNLRVARLHLPLGVPIRWASDVPSDEDQRPLLLNLATLIKEVNDNRAMLRHPEAANVEIYCSTGEMSQKPGAFPANHPNSQTRILSVEDQRQTVEIMGKLYQDNFRERSGNKEDRVMWGPSCDTPVCPACGTSTPIW